MDLHASRSLRRVAVVDFIQAQNLTGRAIELVMIDLETCQGRIEAKFDIGGPGGVLQRMSGCHSCGASGRGARKLGRAAKAKVGGFMQCSNVL